MKKEDYYFYYKKSFETTVKKTDVICSKYLRESAFTSKQEALENLFFYLPCKIAKEELGVVINTPQKVLCCNGNKVVEKLFKFFNYIDEMFEDYPKQERLYYFINETYPEITEEFSGAIYTRKVFLLENGVDLLGFSHREIVEYLGAAFAYHEACEKVFDKMMQKSREANKKIILKTEKIKQETKRLRKREAVYKKRIEELYSFNDKISNRLEISWTGMPYELVDLLQYLYRIKVLIILDGDINNFIVLQAKQWGVIFENDLIIKLQTSSKKEHLKELKVYWNFTNTNDFVRLVYALHKAKKINNGEGFITQIVPEIALNWKILLSKNWLDTHSKSIRRSSRAVNLGILEILDKEYYRDHASLKEQKNDFFSILIASYSRYCSCISENKNSYR